MRKAKAASPSRFETVDRKPGKLNLGLYCRECAEFFALATFEPRDAWKLETLVHPAGAEETFECPRCHHTQQRPSSDLITLLLGDHNARKPGTAPRTA